MLDFNRNNRPSVTANPLPNHVEPNVNAIMEDSSLRVKTKVDEVKAFMEEIYKLLVRMEVIPEKEFFDKERTQEYFCQNHAGYIGHTVQECEEFKNFLQVMMNHGETKFSEKVIQEL